MEGERSMGMYRYKIGIFLVTVLCALSGMLGSVPAEAQVTRGSIEVHTLDAAGGVAVPGAMVRAENSETGLQRQTVTNAQGLALFRALPPGTYDISVELTGFAPVQQKGLVLYSGQTVKVNLKMTLTESASVTVTAEVPVVEVYKSDTSTNIVPQQIEQLPVANRDFEKLAFIAPGVQRERGSYRFISGSPVIGSSGNASQSTIIVDGADFTDQALGLSRTRFSQDAIREFRVITNRFDTEVGNSAAGALAVVTKSGTNEVHGSAFAFYRSDSLRTQGALEEGTQDFSRYQTGFTVGGPIVKDKTHFFVSAEYVNEKNITLFRPGGAFADQAEDVSNPFDQFMFMASLDHQISDAQTVTAKLVYEDYHMDNFHVGGVADVSYGNALDRKNWNLVLNHTWVISDNRLNELHIQAGHRKYDEPTNSTAAAEWFSSGATLQTGTNITGHILGSGDYSGISDTYHLQIMAGNTTHDIKFGGSIQWISEESDIPLYQNGLWIYLTDDRTLPLLYAYGVGSSDIKKDTTLYGAFIQDDWQASSNLTLTFGVRYDLDTDGNNPDFTHPLEPEKRSRDSNNIQPRFSFVWDTKGNGKTVVRGGVGLFTGRYLLVPAFTELQQNGITGRILHSNVNGLLYGLPPAYWLNPADPEHSGLPLPADSTLLAPSLKAPQATQASLGVTQKLGDTGLFLDLEAVYADGRDEIVVRDTNFGGNANPVRLNPYWNQINVYTNQGSSRYKAFIASLNGQLKRGDLVTASLTVASKKNISDDFSPVFPYGYPSDPANIDGEWGRSRNDERVRLVLSGIFHLPWNVIIAPIYEYGSGQPWNHLLGYDFNGDGKNSDRPQGVARNNENGPLYRNLSLRITKTFQLGTGRLDIIVEGFNIFNTVNYDVSSVDAAEFLAGPTLANPSAAYVSNANFGTYRATLDPREIQLGLRYHW